jgi:hypothetical protein
MTESRNPPIFDHCYLFFKDFILSTRINKYSCSSEKKMTECKRDDELHWQRIGVHGCSEQVIYF